jgi:thioredoxin 1
MFGMHFFTGGAAGLKVREIKSERELEKQIGAGIALIDFGAPWCAPCLLQEPIIHRLAMEFEGKALIAEMNIDESPDVALDMGIQSIPTMILFKNGKEIQRFVGLHSEGVLSEALSGLFI